MFTIVLTLREKMLCFSSGGPYPLVPPSRSTMFSTYASKTTFHMFYHYKQTTLLLNWVVKLLFH